jgi:hypothetical protein
MREFGLKRTEARLLIHLYMVHPRLSPTDCIAAALWGFDDVFGTDGIRHSVKRLRRVLGDSVIICSYGVGYRLSDDMAERMPVRPEVELPSFPALPEGKWRGYEPWTDEEDARLADLLALKVSRGALAKVFGRTKDAIGHRAKVIRASERI